MYLSFVEFVRSRAMVTNFIVILVHNNNENMPDIAASIYYIYLKADIRLEKHITLLLKDAVHENTWNLVLQSLNVG